MSILTQCVDADCHTGVGGQSPEDLGHRCSSLGERSYEGLTGGINAGKS